MKRAWVGVVVAAWLACPPPATALPLGYRVDLSTPDFGQEDRLAALVNSVRTYHGFRVLDQDALLRRAARAHSVDMALHGFFGHEDSQGRPFADRFVPLMRTWIVGENIAIARSAEEANGEFLHSPPHVVNMLDPRWTRLGVGVASVGLMGYAYTEDFAGPPVMP